MTQFSDFQIDEILLETLKKLSFIEPKKVQALAIPHVLAGEDVIASAHTGTGKTLAYLLPAIQKIINLQNEQKKGPHLLVLVPTRELALQVGKEAEKLTQNLRKMKTVTIYGGVPYPAQRKALARPYEILIATPGRLIDHMEQGVIDLSRVSMLVLDEADRMLDMGFIEPVEQISEATSPDRQTLLFSATLEKRIVDISRKMQRNPVAIQADDMREAKTNIEQRLYLADDLGHKMRLLDKILEQDKSQIDQAIIFTSTKSHADELAFQLREKGHQSSALHGDMNQRQRSKVIDRLRKKSIDIVVATDVAARGIDIPSLSHVINIDLPYQPEDYIHRIGRTGRRDAKGVAISFATKKESHKLSRINKLMNEPIPFLTIPGFEPKKSTSSEGGRERSTRRFRDRPYGSRDGGGNGGGNRRGRGGEGGSSSRFAPRKGSFKPRRGNAE